jgi:itaconate CoA-transferase
MGIFGDLYRARLTTPRKAVRGLKNGATLIHGMVVAEPPALLGAIADRLRDGSLRDLKVHSLSPQTHAAHTVLAVDLADCVQAYSWFASAEDRKLIKVGLRYYMPNYFHQVPRLMRENLKVDMTVTTVSPMDNAGFFSFGCANDFTSTMARHAKRLVVEVNENMPRVFGDSMVHVSEVDAIVENHVPLMEAPPAEPKPEEERIGQAIVEMIPNGATLQLGVGAIPNAVTGYLADHRDLGLHTELFSPGMIELIEKGVLNGRKKSLHPRKHLFTFCRGTKETYAFMNDNPAMESYPVSYVNDPAVIAKNDRMISVNSIIEIDLQGQCNAEFLGNSQFTGTGGQLDYVRGAYNAKEGKSILAFCATAKNGQISRVVPRLKSGTIVTTPRMDVHYLVTEYGVANLKGKSTRDRALAIIALAHPQFRDNLLREAEDMYLL